MTSMREATLASPGAGVAAWPEETVGAAAVVRAPALVRMGVITAGGGITVEPAASEGIVTTAVVVVVVVVSQNGARKRSRWVSG